MLKSRIIRTLFYARPTQYICAIYLEINDMIFCLIFVTKRTCFFFDSDYLSLSLKLDKFYY